MRADYIAEELLLEGEPGQLGVNPLAVVASAANLNGLLLPAEIVVQLGVLGLVLEALLHPGDYGGEVNVYVGDVARDDGTHSHKGKGVVDHIGICREFVLLLNVSASVKWKPEHKFGV